MSEGEGEVHNGTFAEGQEQEEHHPDHEAQPRYDRGLETGPDAGEQALHRGSFAEGQADEEHHPERGAQPDYGRTQEQDEAGD